MRRVGIFGWGIVAPRSPDIEAFERNLETSDSWLSAFDGFGPSNFLVGAPDFDFASCKGWIDERFPASRFSQLEKKMGSPTGGGPRPGAPAPPAPGSDSPGYVP